MKIFSVSCIESCDSIFCFQVNPRLQVFKKFFQTFDQQLTNSFAFKNIFRLILFFSELLPRAIFRTAPVDVVPSLNKIAHVAAGSDLHLVTIIEFDGVTLPVCTTLLSCSWASVLTISSHVCLSENALFALRKELWSILHIAPHWLKRNH